MELEKAFRSLASFYAKAGPSAALSNEVKSEILQDLDNAEKFMQDRTLHFDTAVSSFQFSYTCIL